MSFPTAALPILGADEKVIQADSQLPTHPKTDHPAPLKTTGWKRQKIGGLYLDVSPFRFWGYLQVLHVNFRGCTTIRTFTDIKITGTFCINIGIQVIFL